MGTGSASGENRAREAAEAAINSPLLEDIDLAGAKGILVNITAGLTLSIGEFDEVGNTVRDFADDEATVVVGTVIDPDLEDELRVTVVATGLGEQRTAVGRPTRIDDRSPMHLVGRAQSESVAPNYEGMERPAIYRKSGAAAAASAAAVQTDRTPDSDLEYLDIPAFLRRQAD